MKKVIVIGASGSLVPFVVEAIEDAEVALFARKKNRIASSISSIYKVTEGDAMNVNELKRAIAGQDIDKRKRILSRCYSKIVHL